MLSRIRKWVYERFKIDSMPLDMMWNKFMNFTNSYDDTNYIEAIIYSFIYFYGFYFGSITSYKMNFQSNSTSSFLIDYRGKTLFTRVSNINFKMFEKIEWINQKDTNKGRMWVNSKFPSTKNWLVFLFRIKMR